MMIGCYIIYSKNLKRHYIGATKDLSTRLSKHKSHFHGPHHFTANAEDWELILFMPCNTFRQAILIEQHLKKMKSSVYLRNLVRFPEMVQKLLIKYSD